MRAGPLRQRLTLQRLVETADPYNQRLQSWVDVATIWGRVINSAGAEVMNARQLKAEVSHIVHTRYLGPLLPAGALPPTWRLLYGDRVLNIVWNNDVNERHREYQITCQQVEGTAP